MLCFGTMNISTHRYKTIRVIYQQFLNFFSRSNNGFKQKYKQSRKKFQRMNFSINDQLRYIENTTKVTFFPYRPADRSILIWIFIYVIVAYVQPTVKRTRHADSQKATKKLDWIRLFNHASNSILRLRLGLRYIGMRNFRIFFIHAYAP